MAISGYQNSGSPDTYTVTDNQSGNTYSPLTRKNSSDANSGVQWFYAKNVNASGTFTITVHFATNVSSVAAAISEWSGCDTTSPFDVENTNGGTGTAVTTGSMTPANANSLYVGVMGTTAGNVSIGEALTKIAERENGGTGAVIAVEYTVSSGAINPGWTMGSSVTWAACGATFKPASTVNTGAGFLTMM